MRARRFWMAVLLLRRNRLCTCLRSADVRRTWCLAMAGLLLAPFPRAYPTPHPASWQVCLDDVLRMKTAVFLTGSAALLTQLQDSLAEIEATNDWTRKRAVIGRYVRQITVETRRVGPRKLEDDVRVFLRLKPAPIAIETTSGWPDGSASRSGVLGPGR